MLLRSNFEGDDDDDDNIDDDDNNNSNNGGKGEYLSRIKSNQSPASRRQCLGQNQSLGKNLR